MQQDAPSRTPFATTLATPYAQNKRAGEGRLYAVPGGRGHLLAVREVAARLGVCTATVYALVERGELPHVRVSNAVRVVPADLEAFVAAGRKGRTP